MRLSQVEGGGTDRRFVYDGDTLIAEYDGNGNLLRRFVHGPGIDEPVVWYEGTGTSDRRFLHQDERGSVVSISNFWGDGQAYATNRYDEYGVPDTNNVGRFGYTGQVWLAEIGLYYYRARMYNPRDGRFMQTDPIGYGDGPNMYASFGNDPVNLTDPGGTNARWPSRIELKRADGGSVSWGSSTGGSSNGGLLDSEGNVRVEVANNIYWEPVGGGRGQWGGNVVSIGGNFYLAGEEGSTGQGGPFDPVRLTLEELIRRLFESNEITETPRPLSTADLGQTVNGRVVVEGTISRSGPRLEIFLIGIYGRGISSPGGRGVVYQTITTALATARGLGLQSVRFSGYPTRRVQIFIQSIIRNRPGVTSWREEGPENMYRYFVEIPVGD